MYSFALMQYKKLLFFVKGMIIQGYCIREEETDYSPEIVCKFKYFIIFNFVGRNDIHSVMNMYNAILLVFTLFDSL